MKNFKFDFAKYNNTIPMIDFLESLSIKEKTLIYKNIQKLIEYKNSDFYISEKFSKFLEDGVFELKVELDNRTSRSLYFYEKEQMIIFTNGFIKKTKKLPRKELEKAKIIKKVYQND